MPPLPPDPVDLASDALRRASSEDLARRARDGSREAFGELVQRFEGSLLRFLRSRLATEGEAEEVAQEAFLRAWRKLGLYDPAQRFSTWLFTLARNLAVSRGRARRLAQDEQELAVLADRDDPARAVADRESGERLWRLADELLTPEQREALWLRYAEDLSAQEIGAVLGKSDVAVRVLLFRARAALARRLEAEAARAERRAPDRTGAPVALPFTPSEAGS